MSGGAAPVGRVLQTLDEYAALVGDDHSVGLCNCDIIAARATVEAMAEALEMMVEMVGMGGFGRDAAADTARAALARYHGRTES